MSYCCVTVNGTKKAVLVCSVIFTSSKNVPIVLMKFDKYLEELCFSSFFIEKRKKTKQAKQTQTKTNVTSSNQIIFKAIYCNF